MSVSKKVLKALGIFGSVQSIGILCSVVRAKLIAVWIGAVGVGLFGIFNSVLDLLAAATQLDLRQASVRDIVNAKGENLPRMAAVVRWWARVLGLLGAVVILSASPALSLASFGTTDWWWAFAVLSVSMFSMAVTTGEQALLQGTGQLKLLAKSTVQGSVAGTVVSIPLYYYLGESSIIPSLVAFALAGMAAVLINQNVKSGKVDTRLCLSEGKSFMKLGAYMTVSSLATYAAAYILKSYIASTASMDAAGYYQAGYTLIVSYVGVVFAAIGMEYYPRLSAMAFRGSFVSKAVSHELALLMCVLAPIVVVFLVADQLIVQILYTQEFMVVLPMITWGIGGAIFRAISYCMSFVIVARGDGRCYVVVEIISAALGLTLNICLYRLYGLRGLGVSYLLWYVAYALMIGCVYVFRYKLSISKAALITTAATIVIVAAAIALRYVAWWMPLPLLALCALLAAWARKR